MFHRSVTILIYLLELFLLPFRDQPFDDNIIRRNVTILPKGIRLWVVIKMLLVISGIETNPGPLTGGKQLEITLCKTNNSILQLTCLMLQIC